AEHGAAVGDQHRLVAVADYAGADEPAACLGQLDRLHAEAAAAGEPVLVDPRPLAVAVLGHDEQIRVVRGDVDLDHLVGLAELHALHALGRTAHRADGALVETHGLTLARDH